jgi:glycosyltransferase involved in cell wall biosynthesis
MKLSIIIPTLNEAELLSKTLDSLVSSRGVDIAEHEIIVIDGGSTDQTRDIVARYPEVRWYESNQSGIAAQSNMGAQYATGDMLVFTDAKTVFPKNALQRISQLPDDKAHFTFMMPTGNNPLLVLFYILQGIWFSIVQFFSPIMPGPCMIIPRNLFEMTSGFSSDFIFQDIEFSHRFAHIARIRVVPIIVRISPRRFYREGVVRTCLLYMGVTFLRMVNVFPKKGTVKYEYGNTGKAKCV